MVALYDTVAEPLSDGQLERAGGADYVTFTSSSTVRFFHDAGGRVGEGTRVVSIGPVTSDTARELGLTVHVEADQHDIDGLRACPAGGREVIITLLTDYGRDDDFVGVCHAVIAGIAPEARMIDVTHGIARHDVRVGALVLRNTLPYLPKGVHVAIVDPQVGTERRAVALRTDGRAHLRRPRQRRAEPGLAAGGRRGGGGGRDALAAPARAGVRHLPRARRVLPGGRAPGARRRAGRGGRAARPGRARDDRAAAAAPRGRLARGARAVDRPLRQRGAQRVARGPGRHRHRARRPGGDAQRQRALPRGDGADLRRRAPRRHPRVRGLLPRALDRDQPRRRRRHAQACARTARCGSRRDDRLARAFTIAARTPPTSAPRSWPSPARRTARWSPPTSRPRAAGARAAAGSRPRARRC